MPSYLTPYNLPRTSIKEAKRRRWSRYNSGRPCKYGHAGIRYVSSRSCVQCDWLRQNGQNPAKVAARRNAYFEMSIGGMIDIMLKDWDRLAKRLDKYDCAISHNS